MGRKNKNARARTQKPKERVGKYINQNHIKQSGIGQSGIGQSRTMPDRYHTADGRSNPGLTYLDQDYPQQDYPRQYEIWYANLGRHYETSIQSGNRPVLIVSNDTANRYSQTVSAIPLTGKLKKIYLPTHVIVSREDCVTLKPDSFERSVLLVEQLITVDKSMLENRICRLTSTAKIRELRAAMETQFGFEKSDSSVSCGNYSNCGNHSNCGNPNPIEQDQKQDQKRGEHNGS